MARGGPKQKKKWKRKTLSVNKLDKQKQNVIFLFLAISLFFTVSCFEPVLWHHERAELLNSDESQGLTKKTILQAYHIINILVIS